ncbi:putative ompA-like autotransporter [Orientia tsutsugamushi str. TA763]|nr:putative ompA-like autotransporter [Orientia tsutsugamushi str. TA763]
MDVRLGFMCHHNCRDNFVQGNYYYNIIEGNKASILLQVASISFNVIGTDRLRLVHINYSTF